VKSCEIYNIFTCFYTYNNLITEHPVHKYGMIHTAASATTTTAISLTSSESKVDISTLTNFYKTEKKTTETRLGFKNIIDPAWNMCDTKISKFKQLTGNIGSQNIFYSLEETSYK